MSMEGVVHITEDQLANACRAIASAINPATPEIIERIGVCECRMDKTRTLFHRLKIRLSRKYRVWPVPGNHLSQLMDPSEFMRKYTVVEAFKPEGGQ